jgi:hypothetical protein
VKSCIGQKIIFHRCGSLSKQDSFSMDENIEKGWLHIAAKMNFGI